MTDAVVRSARAEEAEALLRFWALAGENAVRPTDEPDAVVRLVERDPEALIVAEVDGRIVGTVIAGWDGWRANLYRLAVDPDTRGHGIGGLLLSSAENRLHTLGAERYCAMVLEDNDAGRAFWAANGYTRQDEWRRWVKPASS